VKKNGSFGFAEGSALCVEAKANVPFVRLAKIELKKSAVGKNKKYRRVGKECRLNRCPIVISFLCLWSPVKMVYFFSFLVVCLLLHGRPLRLYLTNRYTHIAYISALSIVNNLHLINSKRESYPIIIG